MSLSNLMLCALIGATLYGAALAGDAAGRILSRPFAVATAQR